MNKPHFIILLYSIGLIFHPAKAANDAYEAGGRSFALSNASVTLVDAYALANNQAATAFLDKSTFAASYRNLFFTSSIGIKHALVGLYSNIGMVGISYQQIDFAGYYDAKAGLSYSRKFSEKFAASLQFDLLMVRPDYEEKMYYNFTGEVGLIAQPSEKLRIGFHLYNPFAMVYKTTYYDEKVPIITRLGLQYHFTDNLFVVLEGEGHSVYGLNIKSGFEYQIIDILAVQAGVSSYPVQISFGTGVQLQNFKVNMGIIQTEKAGRSAGFSLDYSF